MIEHIEARPARPEGRLQYAVLDFDGTVSLIREGWQAIMTPYFTDELAATPGGRDIPRSELELRAKERSEEHTSELQSQMYIDRKSTRLNSSHRCTSRMPSSA